MPNEALAELRTKHLGVWGVVQIAAGTGLAVYAMWVGLLQPGFRKVPLKLQVLMSIIVKTLLQFEGFAFCLNIKSFQVPYIPASKAQVKNVMNLMRGRTGGLVDLGSGDGRIVSTTARLKLIFQH